MSLYASGVTIDPTLSGSLAGVGSPGYNASNNIAANYAAAKKKMGNDASVRRMNATAATGPSSYGGNQLAVKQGLDTGNLESALGGGLGTTAYQNALQQRDFEQQESLANQVGSLNGMNTLEQVLGGVGSVGSAAATAYGAFGKNKTGNNQNPPNPSYANTPAPMSLYGDQGFGNDYPTSYDPYGYDMDQMQGYKLNPNMLNNYGNGGGY